jgi:hypothetical protein
MFLIKVENLKCFKNKHRYIRICKKIFLVKSFTNSELENVIKDSNIIELLKINKNNVLVIKSEKLKLFEGIEI